MVEIDKRKAATNPYFGRPNNISPTLQISKIPNTPKITEGYKIAPKGDTYSVPKWAVHGPLAALGGGYAAKQYLDQQNKGKAQQGKTQQNKQFIKKQR